MRQGSSSPRWTVAVVLLALTTSACGNDTAAQPAPVVVEAGEPFTDGIPAPADTPVLTVVGASSSPNDGDDVSLDLATLERLRREQWTVFDPFEDRDVVYEGIPWTAVLVAVGVPADATEIRLTALDDYQITLTVEDLRSGGALLALRDELPGEIEIERGGPIRTVWRDDSPPGDNPDLWIWSLRTVEFL